MTETVNLERPATADELISLFRAGDRPGEIELIARLDGAEAALAVANEEIRNLTADNADLATQLATAKAAATKAGKAARASAATQGPKARTFKRDAPRASSEDLLAAIGEAETVEVVFCDNGKEVLGIPPVRVQGDAWSVRSQGLLMMVPVLVNGPAVGHSPYAVTGFGLVLDGKPTLYAQRMNGQLTIGAGARVNVEADIIF